MLRLIALVIFSMIIVTPVFAHPCKDTSMASCRYVVDDITGNPDGRTSLTFLAGFGEAEDNGRGDADLGSFSATLVHPTTNNLSLIFKYDWNEAQWERFYVYGMSIDRSYNANQFSLGFRWFLP